MGSRVRVLRRVCTLFDSGFDWLPEDKGVDPAEIGVVDAGASTAARGRLSWRNRVLGTRGVRSISQRMVFGVGCSAPRMVLPVSGGIRREIQVYIKLPRPRVGRGSHLDELRGLSNEHNTWAVPCPRTLSQVNVAYGEQLVFMGKRSGRCGDASE